MKRRSSLGLGDVFRRRRSITTTPPPAAEGNGNHNASLNDASLLSASSDSNSCGEQQEREEAFQNSCASFVTHATTQSMVQRIFAADAPCRLDSKTIVTVSNTWARVKRHAGYEEDVGEAIIMCMMDLDPKTREKLRITSFRSPRFGEVCRAMSDLVDLVVTLLGPDLDDEDLWEAGERFREEGINLELFAKCVSAGIRVRLPPKYWSSKVESAWQSTFEMLLPSMTVQQ